MPRAIRGVLVKVDPSIKAIIVNIDAENHAFIIEDLDEDHLVIKENMVSVLKGRIDEILAAVLTVSNPNGAESDSDY
ncbi:RNA polymerase II transcription factor B subunit 5 [Calycina marina]|uniref:General transcription and DNA repair factor IIH subunit TFB5 n=1 Tax=Calycina marina TaxID=1763456 RepID=A0A9P7YYK3_9HELO|nr:RNA polymerase II transcription factor B subunit 5 [Calycina marina]